jgi:hypothetical protein|eukprot:COSAG01_NODE_3907_length_5556_cov_8.827378_3_plen_135_part_00
MRWGGAHPRNLVVRLLGAGLGQKRLVDVRDDTTASDRGLDEGVELLITADGELQVTRRDTLHFEVLGRVASQLEDLGGEVLQDGRAVDGGGGADAALGNDGVLEEAVDTADRELRRRKQRLVPARTVRLGRGRR